MGTTYIAGIGWGVVADDEDIKKEMRKIIKALPADSEYKEHYAFNIEYPYAVSIIETFDKETLAAESIGHLDWEMSKVGIFAKSTRSIAYDFDELSFDAFPVPTPEEIASVNKYAEPLGLTPKWHIYMYVG